MATSMVLGQVLWDSLLYRYRSLVTFSGTIVAGFELGNAFDWRDFTSFRVPTGTSTISLTLPLSLSGSVSIDSFVMWCVSNGTGLNLVATLKKNGTTIGTVTAGATSGITWNDLSPSVTVSALDVVTVVFNNATGSTMDIRQISFGPKVTFPIGQWSGINPPNLYQGVVVENVFSVNGSIIGRNIRRLEKQGSINLTHLAESWVRTTWDTFIQNVARHAFFYRWNPVGYPAEVAFAAADQINAPTNMMPPPLMQVQLGLKLITQ